MPLHESLRARSRASIGAEEAEGEESSISLAAMEAQLKPSALATFDAIAEIHKKLHRLQDQRITALYKGEELPRATERRYEKLKAAMIEQRQAGAPQQYAHRASRRAALRRQSPARRRGRQIVAAGREQPASSARSFLQHYIGERARRRIGSSVSRVLPGRGWAKLADKACS